ncbi:hypothetical protein QYF61_020875 [Mycteria americana]|uniref:Uncharacterized protein n=1 Tax=Mycteria americana TaxID=33587 RepID=A0AAN7MWW0_MYCAM|nr:hypothetical protein QYF61_020875 [Mycteria americana]
MSVGLPLRQSGSCLGTVIAEAYRSAGTLCPKTLCVPELAVQCSRSCVRSSTECLKQAYHLQDASGLLSRDTAEFLGVLCCHPGRGWEIAFLGSLPVRGSGERRGSPGQLTERLEHCPRSHVPVHLGLPIKVKSEHVVTESQNHIGWKRPLRSSSPTLNLTLPSPPLHHVPQHLIHTAFKYPRDGDSTTALGSLVQCWTTLSVKENSLISIVESDEVSPQPPFLQAEQPQVPQPLPISLVLQTLPQLRCPSLDTLQPLNVSLGVRGPTLNTAFEVRPHQCPVQGHDHCPSPAGHTISDTSQDAIGLLGHLGTLLAHIQPAVNQDRLTRLARGLLTSDILLIILLEISFQYKFYLQLEFCSSEYKRECFNIASLDWLVSVLRRDGFTLFLTAVLSPLYT